MSGGGIATKRGKCGVTGSPRGGRRGGMLDEWDAFNRGLPPMEQGVYK